MNVMTANEPTARPGSRPAGITCSIEIKAGITAHDHQTKAMAVPQIVMIIAIRIT